MSNFWLFKATFFNVSKKLLPFGFNSFDGDGNFAHDGVDMLKEACVPFFFFADEISLQTYLFLLSPRTTEPALLKHDENTNLMSFIAV